MSTVGISLATAPDGTTRTLTVRHQFDPRQHWTLRVYSGTLAEPAEVAYALCVSERDEIIAPWRDARNVIVRRRTNAAAGDGSRRAKGFWGISTGEKSVRILIALAVGAAIYLAVGFVLGAWFWIGVAEGIVALVGVAADRLVRAAWETAPPREPIRLPPVPPAERRPGPRP